MRTHKIIIELELGDRESPESWLKNTLGSIKFGRVKSIRTLENKIEEKRKVSKEKE